MSMKASMTKTVGAAALALSALSGAAQAEDREFSWSVNAAGTSDYVFRGVSQTDEQPAFQAGIDASYGIFYIGAWGSNVDSDFVGGSSAEIDFYAGIKPTWGPATFDFGVIYYWYPGSSSAGAGDPDVVELKAGVSGELVKNLSAGAVLYWSDEAAYDAGEYFVYEGTLAYALPKVFIFDPSISGTVGHVDNQDVPNVDYTYWNAGLTLSVEKFSFDFRYWDTDGDTDFETAAGGLADERFVFTAKVALP
jgi:uncharacterized protein (TIGR02001 family)